MCFLCGSLTWSVAEDYLKLRRSVCLRESSSGSNNDTSCILFDFFKIKASSPNLTLKLHLLKTQYLTAVDPLLEYLNTITVLVYIITDLQSKITISFTNICVHLNVKVFYQGSNYYYCSFFILTW